MSQLSLTPSLAPSLLGPGGPLQVSPILRSSEVSQHCPTDAFSIPHPISDLLSPFVAVKLASDWWIVRLAPNNALKDCFPDLEVRKPKPSERSVFRVP